MERRIKNEGIDLPANLKEAVSHSAQVRIDMGPEGIALEAHGTNASIMTAAGILLRDLAVQLKDENVTELDVIGIITYIARETLELNDMEAAAADTGDAI